MNNNKGDSSNNVRSVKKKLLDKYDLTVDKLDFDYVKKCKNVGELEKICKVLRSGEEGFYPDLQKTTEDCLRKLSPDNRIFRVEEPIVRREDLPKSQRDEIERELESFKSDIVSKDEQLQKATPSAAEELHPPIRRAKPTQKNTKESKTSAKKPAISDYATWDKYDADSEIIKMDLEEEKKNEIAKSKAKHQNTQLSEEDNRIQDIITRSENLTEAEKSVLALREKDRGNDYYKVADFEEALRYYTASIAIQPNAVAYSNRAACYLKLSKFELALSDANEALRLEPGNTKALFRRAVCLQHKLNYNAALEDFEAVLAREPNNVMVRHMADRLAEQCNLMPRTVRMLVEDDKGVKSLVEMSEEEAKRVKKGGHEVNEFGLAKTMCRCYGRPAFLNSPNTNAIAEHLLCDRPDTNEHPLCESQSESSKQPIEPDNINSKLNLNVNYLENANEAKPKVMEIEDENSSIDVNRILFSSSSTVEGLTPPPQKIKIVETVGLSDVHNTSNKKKSVVKDMRRGVGVGNAGNKNDLDLNVRMNDMKVGDLVVGGGDGKKVNDNSNLNCSSGGDNNLNNTSSDGEPIKRPSSISVADKYKVCSVGDVTDVTSPMTPHKYYTLCSSVRSEAEFGRILRSTDPKQLDNLLSNKLDERMLCNMVRALAVEFELNSPTDVAIVSDYLLAISRLQRINIVAMLLKSETKQLLRNLINRCCSTGVATALLNSFSLD